MITRAPCCIQITDVFLSLSPFMCPFLISPSFPYILLGLSPSLHNPLISLPPFFPLLRLPPLSPSRSLSLSLSPSLSYFVLHYFSPQPVLSCPSSDRDGKLALSAKQRSNFGEWMRPDELCSGPQMIIVISSFSIKQVMTGETGV